jgi:transcription antitermination factor NusG
MTDNNVKKWYVVRAVSGQENKVKAIETEIKAGLSDYVSQVLVPTGLFRYAMVKKSVKIKFTFLVM